MKKFDDLKGGISVLDGTVYTYENHIHTYYEMTLYEPFSGAVSINGKDFDISSPSCVIICPGDSHEISVQENTGSRFIKIGFNTDIPGVELPAFSIILQEIAEDNFALALFGEILKKHNNKPYISHLISCIIHILLVHGEKILPIKSPKGAGIAINAAKYLHEHFAEDITLESVASGLSVSPQYLSASFNNSLGQTFSQYLQSLRLQYAAHLLTEAPQKNATEICYESGYNNFSHFSRSFKKYYKMSPREYKNQSK